MSVVIATRDRAHLLVRAATSVRTQTYGDWELIIVDDGSVDGTARILDELAVAEPRLRVHRLTRPVGAAAARNAGAALARGKLLAFLDDDDEWLPDKLALQLERLDQQPDAVLVHGPFYEVSGGEAPLQGRVAARRGRERSKLLRANYLGHSTVLVRLDAFRRAGGYDPQLPRLQDWDLWIRLAGIGVFAFVDAPLARVHHTAGAISTCGDALVRAAEWLFERGRRELGWRECGEMCWGLAHLLAREGEPRHARRAAARALVRQPWPPRSIAFAAALILGRQP